MSEFLIVRINDKLIPEFQIKYNAHSEIAEKSTASSWQDIKQNKNQTLIIIVAANLVFNIEVNIPSKNDDIVRQSIPFAIEEKLANEITDNHYAYLQKPDQDVLVSVIDKNSINQIRQSVLETGLQCNALYSEIFSIPTFSGLSSLLVAENYIIINEDFHKGTTIEKDSLDLYLKLSKNNSKIIFSDKKITIEKLDEDVFKICDTALLQAKTITNGEYVNLFQGGFKITNDEDKKENKWLNLIALSAFLIISWLFVSIYQIWNLNSEIEQLKFKQKEFLVKIIPNASQTEKNDPYAAIQSFLKVKNSDRASGSISGFITELSYIGTSLVNFPSIQVQSLRKRQAKLEMKVLAPNVATLNKFQSTLEKNAVTMRVKVGTRDTSKNGIISVITMEKL